MGLERVAEGVSLLRGDFRGAMNIYVLESEGGSSPSTPAPRRSGPLAAAVAWVRLLYTTLLRRGDGGAVEIAGTVAECDRVAGFEVLHSPAARPG